MIVTIVYDEKSRKTEAIAAALEKAGHEAVVLSAKVVYHKAHLQDRLEAINNACAESDAVVVTSDFWADHVAVSAWEHNCPSFAYAPFPMDRFSAKFDCLFSWQGSDNGTMDAPKKLVSAIEGVVFGKPEAKASGMRP